VTAKKEQRENEDTMAETMGNGEKRVCATDEESRGKSEKEMVEEIGRRRKLVAPMTDLEGK
jgi:hypothetical protein